MTTEIKTSDLIVVEQLPVIVERLHGIKADAEQKVQEALSLACTEDTVQVVKKRRAELNADFGELEARRKAVKKEVMAPYNAFEAVYKECVTDVFGPADKQLARKIADVEDGLKQDKASKVVAYFNELQRANPELEWISFEDVGLNITLSASLKSLKATVKKYMDDVAKDIECIRGMANGLEVLDEYKQVRNLAAAVSSVHKREMRIAAERNAAAKRAEEVSKQAEAVAVVQEIVAEDAALQPPTEAVPEAEEAASAAERKFSATFKVTDTLPRLRALKAWLEKEGYQYEC